MLMVMRIKDTIFDAAYLGGIVVIKLLLICIPDTTTAFNVTIVTATAIFATFITPRQGLYTNTHVPVHVNVYPNFASH